MKTHTLRPRGDKHPSDELHHAKMRLRQAAQDAGPSALVRRHPWSSMIGTMTGAFALTTIVKLFAKRPIHVRSNGFVSSSSSKPGKSSTYGPLLQSLLHMGLPIIQSQFIRLLNQRRQESDSIRTERCEEGMRQDRTNAMG